MGDSVIKTPCNKRKAINIQVTPSPVLTRSRSRKRQCSTNLTASNLSNTPITLVTFTASPSQDSDKNKPTGNVFKTPVAPKERVNNVDASISPVNSKKINIPPSPAMELLGYGTGVNVFLLERSSVGGIQCSPWAIKKISKCLQKQEADSSPLCNEGYRRIGLVDRCNSRLEKEAKVLRTLKHENIVGFRDYLTDSGGFKCLAMEAAERDLYNILESRYDSSAGPLPSHQMRIVVRDITSALKYLHFTARILHGDMKSNNILISGNFRQAKLCDFGVCMKLTDKLVPEDKTECYLGTESWSPPETLTCSQNISDKCDIFAFGLVIWECFTCTPPFVYLLDGNDSEDDLSSEEQDILIEQRNEIFRQNLGTRPPLPEECFTNISSFEQTAVLCFYQCTEPDPTKRPNACLLQKIVTAAEKPTAVRKNLDFSEQLPDAK